MRACAWHAAASLSKGGRRQALLLLPRQAAAGDQKEGEGMREKQPVLTSCLEWMKTKLERQGTNAGAAEAAGAHFLPGVDEDKVAEARKECGRW